MPPFVNMYWIFSSGASRVHVQLLWEKLCINHEKQPNISMLCQSQSLMSENRHVLLKTVQVVSLRVIEQGF